MLLALLLAAAPSPVELHALSAGLLAPETKKPVGAVDDVPLTATRWRSQTVFRARHQSKTVELEAWVDLSREGTYVEAVASRDVALSAGGPWTVVLKRGAKVPLLGRVADGLRVGFLPRHRMALPAATVPDEARSIPSAAGPVEPCLVRALHARPDASSAKWGTPSSAWTVHRGASTKAGWAPAWAESEVTIVHGFVRDADVVCDEGPGSGLGLSGTGAGSGDGMVVAREVTLPAGSKLFSSPAASTPIATLKVAVRALVLDDGTVRTDPLESGAGSVRFSNVVLAKDVVLPMLDARPYGVGSTMLQLDGWPRLTP